GIQLGVAVGAAGNVHLAVDGAEPCRARSLWHRLERAPSVASDVIGIKRVYHAKAEIRGAASYINDSIPKWGRHDAQRCRRRCAGSPSIRTDIVNPDGVGRLDGLIMAPENIDLAVDVHRRSREVVVGRWSQ